MNIKGIPKKVGNVFASIIVKHTPLCGLKIGPRRQGYFIVNGSNKIMIIKIIHLLLSNLKNFHFILLIISSFYLKLIKQRPE